MKILEGINWVITCTANVDQSVAFFRDVMGFTRYPKASP